MAVLATFGARESVAVDPLPATGSPNGPKPGAKTTRCLVRVRNRRIGGQTAEPAPQRNESRSAMFTPSTAVALVE